MNITANRLELLAAVEGAERIAPSASPLDILKCVCLETENGALTVAATNQEISMERKLPANILENGRIAINAKILLEMLKRLGEDTVTFEQTENRLVSVKSGEAEYLISAMNAGEYPRAEIPFPEDTVTVTGIPDMAKRTAFAASRKGNDPLLTCVCLRFNGGDLNAVSTDGQRIASAKGESKNPATVNLLVPASSLARLGQLVTNQDEIRVGIAGKNAVFMKEGLMFSARLMEGKYANVDGVIKALKPRFSVLTNAEDMRKMVSAACTVSGEQNRFKLSFHGGKLQAVCESECGVSKMELEVTALSGRPSGDCWMNPAKLLECLQAQKGAMKLEVAGSSALVMRTEELIYVQLLTKEPKPIQLERSKIAAETDAVLKEAA